MTIHQFPSDRVRVFPVIGRFPDADAGVRRAIERIDREVFDADAVEFSDDETDTFVTMPIRVGTHHGEPTIEIGKYSMSPDDARVLAGLLTKFADNFRRCEVSR